MKVKRWKPGSYGKGAVSRGGHFLAVWRVPDWNAAPHHERVIEKLGLGDPAHFVGFHVDQQGRFFFHHQDDDTARPANPKLLAASITRRRPELTWGGRSVERHEQQGAEQP